MQRRQLGPQAAQPGPHPSGAPRLLLTAKEGGRSPLLEAMRRLDLAVLVAPTGGLLPQVESGAVDVVLLHVEAAEALDLLALLKERAVPIVVALREGRLSLDRFLAAGAEDCVAAGVTRGELAARIRAVLRRRGCPLPGEVLRSGPLLLDLSKHLFRIDGRSVHLPPKEFGLLELLLRRDGRVVSREEALHTVWGPSHSGDPTTVDVHVKRLRAKVEQDPAHPEKLLTVRGLGYRLQV